MAEPGARSDSASRVVLVIDEDPQVARLVRLTLQRPGCQVFVAGRAQEGLRVAARQKPHLIIMETRFGATDGLMLAGKLMQAPGTRTSAVAFLTDERAASRVIQAVQLGAVDYLLKPVDGRALFGEVDAIFARLALGPPHAVRGSGAQQLMQTCLRVGRDGQSGRVRLTRAGGEVAQLGFSGGQLVSANVDGMSSSGDEALRALVNIARVEDWSVSFDAGAEMGPPRSVGGDMMNTQRDALGAQRAPRGPAALSLAPEAGFGDDAGVDAEDRTVLDTDMPAQLFRQAATQQDRLQGQPTSQGALDEQQTDMEPPTAVKDPVRRVAPPVDPRGGSRRRPPSGAARRRPPSASTRRHPPPGPPPRGRSRGAPPPSERADSLPMTGPVVPPPRDDGGAAAAARAHFSGRGRAPHAPGPDPAGASPMYTGPQPALGPEGAEDGHSHHGGVGRLRDIETDATQEVGQLLDATHEVGQLTGATQEVAHMFADQTGPAPPAGAHGSSGAHGGLGAHDRVAFGEDEPTSRAPSMFTPVVDDQQGVSAPQGAMVPQGAPPPDGLELDPQVLAGWLGAMGNPPLLLAVQDPSAEAALRAAAEQRGLTVVTASSASEVYNLAQARRPAVVIADARLPDAEGRELLTALRSDYLVRESSFLMVSGPDLGRQLAVSGAGVLAPILKGLDASLAARAELWRQLGAGASELNGWLDPVGTTNLLRILGAVSFGGRVALRVGEQRNAEVVFRRGEICGVTVNAPQASVGPLAMLNLIGFEWESFGLLREDQAGAQVPLGDLAGLVENACHQNNVMMQRVYSEGLRIDGLTVDEQALDAYVRTLPGTSLDLLLRFKGGEPPAALAAEGASNEGALRALMHDMRRKSVLRAQSLRVVRVEPATPWVAFTPREDASWPAPATGSHTSSAGGGSGGRGGRRALIIVFTLLITIGLAAGGYFAYVKLVLEKGGAGTSGASSAGSGTVANQKPLMSPAGTGKAPPKASALGSGTGTGTVAPAAAGSGTGTGTGTGTGKGTGTGTGTGAAGTGSGGGEPGTATGKQPGAAGPGTADTAGTGAAGGAGTGAGAKAR